MLLDNKPIDAVIAWVDGQDPAHRDKISMYKKQATNLTERASGETRYNSVGEIFFCVASIIRFAPFIRRIFIVTDNQDPGLGDFLKINFPENKTPVTIVDHKDIFSGYEDVLPTFNSISIETCIHRIPGLSDRYIYFNDDFLLARPVAPEDFFTGEGIVLRGYWRNFAADTFFMNLKKRIKGGPASSEFKESMRNAAKILSFNSRYLYVYHTPHPQIRSLLEEYYTSDPEAFGKNISYRFRDYTQHSSQVLCYLLAAMGGRYEIRKDKELYISPAGRKKGYLTGKIRTFENNKPLFLCLQSLDMASDNDYELIVGWLSGLLDIKIDLSKRE